MSYPIVPEPEEKYPEDDMPAISSTCPECGCEGKEEGEQLHWKECSKFQNPPCWHNPDDPSCHCD